MSEPDTSTQDVDAELIQVQLRMSPDERADLMRRAGEVQATVGEKISVQNYIRSQLWPNRSTT